MGQRLDRPSTTTPSNAVMTNVGGSGTVSSSLSTTFSSSSASSTSSSSSNTSAVNNNNRSNTEVNSNISNGVNVFRDSTRNPNSRHSRHYRNQRPRGSTDGLTVSSSSNAVNINSSNMSPRTRFRTEMTRRGYPNSSSDLFFRLFQFPSPQQASTSSTLTSSEQSNSQSNEGGQNQSESTTPTPTATGSNLRGTGSNTSGGLSALRFFNLGTNSSNNNNRGDLESDLSSDDDEPHWNHNFNSLAQSLPLFFGLRDFKCFVCSKTIPADDVEAHIMMCLTKPRLTYNDDVLTDNKGECIICFEDLEKGQTIARLPCLCIYHKHCIDDWLSRSQSCPGHPPD